jgi:acyl-CoA synthetase (NDP forming)
MRVMVIGASSRREKFGNKAVRAYMKRGHQVFPVNPREDQVEGLRAYADVGAVPGPIDRAAMYVPPGVGVAVVEALAARGDVAEVFFNPGTESPELLERARALGLNTTFGCAIIDIGERPD